MKNPAFTPVLNGENFTEKETPKKRKKSYKHPSLKVHRAPEFEEEIAPESITKPIKR